MSEKSFNGAVFIGPGVPERRKDDFYPTPWEATVALLKVVKFPKRIWEPACGDGAMAKALGAHGHAVYATDLHDRGYGESGRDFLQVTDLYPKDYKIAIVTNPPFKLAEQFIRKALSLTPRVAMLLKSQFWHAASRLQLYRDCSPDRIFPLTWRLDFTNGGAPTMDCMWCVWGIDMDGHQRYQPLPKPEPHEHPVFR